MCYHLIMSKRINLSNLQGTLERGQKALATGRDARTRHRWRKRPDREAEITAAVDTINDVMRRVRSIRQAAAFRVIAEDDDFRVLSDELQRERRKLRKMLGAGK